MYFSSIKNYISASRPRTLLVSFSVWLVGVSLSSFQMESVSLILNGVILACMLLLQIAVNFFNDALDFKNNKDTESRLGTSRMVQSGKVAYTSMMKQAYIVLSLAFLLGVYLVYYGGWPILIIGILGMLSVYFYSAPLFSIADRGLSEIFVFLFFGVLAVGGIVYLNTKEWTVPSLIAGSQMGFLSISLLLVNHLRDQKEDFHTGKSTWVVRKGRVFGLMELAFSIFFPYMLGYYWLIIENNWEAFIYPLCVLPFHIYIFHQVSQELPSKKYNFYLALTSFGQLLFVNALMLGWMKFSFFN